MIFSCFNRLVCFSMGLPTWWRFGLCLRNSSLVFCDVTHRTSVNSKYEVTNENNGATNDSSFGRKMRFCGKWWTISWKHFPVYFALLNSCLAVALLYVIHNTWLAPSTLYWTQSTAFGIEMRRRGSPWIGDNSILAKTFQFRFSV